MDKIELAGFTAEQAESIREAARKYAERTTFTAEEATEKILGALNFISGEIREAFDKLTAVFRELAEELEPIDIEPRVRRRKRNRARAKIIEQQYRAEIRRAENTRIYRRIYKPPYGANRRRDVFGGRKRGRNMRSEPADPNSCCPVERRRDWRAVHAETAP